MTRQTCGGCVFADQAKAHRGVVKRSAEPVRCGVTLGAILWISQGSMVRIGGCFVLVGVAGIASSAERGILAA